LVFHLVKIQFAQLLVSVLQGGVIGDAVQFEHLADLIGRQQPFFLIPIAVVQVKHHQHTGCQLWESKVMVAFEKQVLGQRL